MSKKVTKVVVYFDDGTYQEVGGIGLERFFQPSIPEKSTWPSPAAPQWTPVSTPTAPFINKDYVLD